MILASDNFNHSKIHVNYSTLTNVMYGFESRCTTHTIEVTVMLPLQLQIHKRTN